MTRNVEVIGPEATLEDAASRMDALDIGPLPVCENDRLVGMITDRATSPCVQPLWARTPKQLTCATP